MGRTILEMIGEFGKNVQAIAGMGVRAKVMSGSDKVTSRTDPAVVACWMKEAVGRLDGLAGKRVRGGIMARCGTACIRANGVFIPRAEARRKKFVTEDDFLAAEVRRPLAGTRLERRGNILFHTYTPRSFNPPRRCYCRLVAALPIQHRIVTLAGPRGGPKPGDEDHE
ncbi:MAG: hypothetical protein ABSG19_06875 [Candidatus Aminicenantales bacterium]